MRGMFGVYEGVSEWACRAERSGVKWSEAEWSGRG